MSDGKHCPACGRDIGVWSIFTAGLPNRIRCPHCSVRLTYNRLGGVVVVLLIATAAVAAVGVYAADEVPGLDPRRRPAWAAGIMLGLWVPVELVVIRFLRRSRVLVRLGEKGKPPAAPGETW